MADDDTYVTKTITAQNTFSDWLQVRVPARADDAGRPIERRSFSRIQVKATSTAAAHTFTVQVKDPDESAGVAQPLASPPTVSDTVKIAELVGDIDVRIGIETGNFGSGTATVILSR